MKIALYIEDGLEQIVLTPESDTEKAILGKLHDGSRELEIYSGAFYSCRGGWVRHKERHYSPGLYDSSKDRDESSMIVLREKKPVERDVPANNPGAIMTMEEIVKAGL